MPNHLTVWWGLNQKDEDISPLVMESGATISLSNSPFVSAIAKDEGGKMCFESEGKEENENVQRRHNPAWKEKN